VRRGSLLIGALVLLAVLASIGSQEPGGDSPLPSASNRGPRGLAVLATWLRGAGVEVVERHERLDVVPPGVRTVVLAEPAAEELREDEVAALRAFVVGGGTLIYLVPRSGPQPALQQWLPVSAGIIPPLVTEAGVEDVGGTTVAATLQGGLLRGVRTLRLSADRTLAVLRDDALAVTTHDAVWWVADGAGEVWLSAGADLAENARLELADNARFWANLGARGPVLFSEYHQRRADKALPRNLVVSGLQLAFLAALFLWARGARLGPPRDEPGTQPRSAQEHVQAMAALLQNAGVEAELAVALKADFRRRLAEERGIPSSWAWEEADAELARRFRTAPGALLSAIAHPGFVPLSRALAALEHQLSG
jgi:hypothetical protein